MTFQRCDCDNPIIIRVHVPYVEKKGSRYGEYSLDYHNVSRRLTKETRVKDPLPSFSFFHTRTLSPPYHLSVSVRVLPSWCIEPYNDSVLNSLFSDFHSFNIFLNPLRQAITYNEFLLREYSNMKVLRLNLMTFVVIHKD